MIDNVKLEIKENLKLLINSGQFEKAKTLLGEYKKIVPNDIESYSMDSVILMMEGSLDEAEIVLKKGITYDDKNFDLLYNLGYLYEKKSYISEALKYYRKASLISTIQNQKNDVNEIIESLEQKFNTNICSSLNVEGITKYFDKEIEGDLLQHFKNKDFNKIIQAIDAKINNGEYGDAVSICDFWIKNVDNNTGVIYFFMGICYWQVQIQYFWQIIIQFFVFSRGRFCPCIF